MSREEALFFAALELSSAGDRAALLDRECAGDAELRAAVQGLLRANEKAEAGFPDALPDITVVLPDAGAPVISEQTLLTGSPAVQGGAGAEVTLPPESYAVGGEIARGGMGTVLEAEDRRLGRKVAMKVMRLEASASEDARSRFVREATVLARLEHPNIVPIHELGRDTEGRPFYTMKLVHGRTLQAVIDGLRQGEPDFVRHYTLDRLLTIFRKICDALSLAHAKGVIHRDLKPQNVMVGEFGEVLVMDWGIAKIVGDAQQAAEESAGAGVPANVPEALRGISWAETPGAAGLTMEGTVMGTPHYMSPEQAAGHVAEIDPQSDVFSLGAILYALLALRPPVEADSLSAVLEKIQRGDIRPPTEFNPRTGTGGKGRSLKGAPVNPREYQPLPQCPGGKVPAALSLVAMQALTVDKARRYATVAALAADVEAFQGGFATSAEHAGFFTQLRLLVRRHRREFAIGFAAWLLITALAVWFVFNLRAKERRAVAGEKKATAAEAVAKDAQAVAVREKETARQALAKSQLDLAEKEFERGKFVEAQKILGETPESFRDANWHFLRAHSQDFSAQILPPPGMQSALRLQVVPQGDRFFVRCVQGIGLFTPSGEQIGAWLVANGGLFGRFGINRAGDRVAFAKSAREIVVYEMATRKLMRSWPYEIGETGHVLLSPDGETVLAAGGKQLTAYAVETGAQLWVRPYHGVAPAFGPDGRTVAVLAAKTGSELRLELVDTLTGVAGRTLEATADNPVKTTLQFDQTGDQLACFGGDEVILWDARTARKIRALHFPGETVILLSPGGDAVATTSGTRIRLWDATTGSLQRSLNGASSAILDLAFSPDGRTLLSAHKSSQNTVVNVWPTRLAEAIASVRPGTSQARGVRFDSNASKFYTVVDKVAGSWEARSGSQNWMFTTSERDLRGLAIHPVDGSIVLSEFNLPKLTRLSAPGKPLESFGSSVHSSLRFNHTGDLLLAVEGPFNQFKPGPAFLVMEYPSGNVLQRIALEKTASKTDPYQPFAAFCLDDAAVATAAKTGGITVWDWKAGAPLRQIAAAQTGSIACLASSPDGRHLASGGPDRWIRVWEAATGRLEAAFRAHWEGVLCVKFTPDGREILSGSEDGTVRISDAANGEERLALYGLTTPVVDVDISADGKLIAAITTDGFTKVWDRQLSSAAALGPQRPKRPKPAAAKDADGWEDLFAQLTPAEVEMTGHGWSLKDGELFSPDTKFATLPLPGEWTGTSYRVRVTLRQLTAKNVFYVSLPVADRMCGFYLETRPSGGIYTGIGKVNGEGGENMPGVVKGKQVNDTEPHDLEMTVRLDGANATITTTLDDKPLYVWTGPSAALSQYQVWATTEPGTLALGTYAGGWAVSEVKVKRLDAGK